MSRYVVFSREKQPAEREVERIMKELGVTVIDRSAGRMLLVEATEAAASDLRERLEGWVVSKETVLPRPGRPRYRISSGKPD